MNCALVTVTLLILLFFPSASSLEKREHVTTMLNNILLIIWILTCFLKLINVCFIPFKLWPHSWKYIQYNLGHGYMCAPHHICNCFLLYSLHVLLPWQCLDYSVYTCDRGHVAACKQHNTNKIWLYLGLFNRMLFACKYIHWDKGVGAIDMGKCALNEYLSFRTVQCV